MPATTRHRSKQAVAATKPASHKASNKASAERSTASAASTSQPIQMGQSTEVVQSLLHAGISCAAYLRQLFPDDCFTQRKYENRHEHWSYDDWISGKKGQGSKSERTGVVVPILKRAVNKRVDHLLDWLEKGVFDALKKRYLQTFHFQIIEKESQPFEVLETYVFKIGYTEPQGAALVEIGMPDGTSAVASVWKVRLNFTQIIKQLCLYCPTLAELPAQRSLRIQLTYNDNCPDDYEPPGFMAGVSDTIAFPSGDGWVRKTATMGDMKTGYHGLILRINHLENGGLSPEDKQIPAKLPYTDVTSIVDDENSEPREPQDTEIQNSGHNSNQQTVVPSLSRKASKARSLEINHDQHENLQDLSLQQGRSRGQPYKTTEHPGELSESSANPGELDNSDHYSLRDALQQQLGTRSGSGTRLRPTSAVELEHPDTVDRNFFRNVLQDTPMDESYPDTQPIKLTPQELESQMSFLKQGIGLQLSGEKLSTLVRAKEREELPSPLKRRNTGLDLQGLGSIDVIKCECDWSGEDPEQMLQCPLCENWQHSYCYGYRGRSDKRMPKDRLCYNCLKAGEDPKMFPALQELALKRCGIRYIERFDFLDVPKFAEGLGIDRQTASRLASYLRERKYLVPTSAQKNQLNTLHNIVRTGPAYERMMTECFQPFKHIEHLHVPQDRDNRTQAFESDLTTPSASEKSMTLASEAKPVHSSLATEARRKGKQPATATSTEQRSYSAMQTPRRKRRSREEWMEEVGRRVTPKRACKNSVSTGFINAAYSFPNSPAVTLASADDDEMEL